MFADLLEEKRHGDFGVLWPVSGANISIQLIGAVDSASKKGFCVEVTAPSTQYTIHDQGSEVDFSGTKHLARKMA